MGRPGLWEGGGGKIPFHLFPAPGDENRDHYLDDLLFRAFVCFGLFFFNFTKRTLQSFQISS